MKARGFLTLLALLSLGGHSFAGGPLAVGSKTKGVEGQPFVWAAGAMPIHYRVDSGPMSVNPSGTVVIPNSQGLVRVQNMVNTWAGVPTAQISFVNDGALTVPAGGHVSSLNDFNAVVASCNSGQQTPIVFDGNGSIFSALGFDQNVIGFAAPCNFSQAGNILNAYAMLNGQMQDGVSSSTNPEMPAAAFDEAIVHEFGHFLGLDHSQINLQTFTSFNFTNCPADGLAGLPVMFPVSFCQARVTAGLPALAPDDVAWISKLYPASTYATSYGTISGYILFSDGLSHMQGVNVIARRVDDPNTPQDESQAIAFSVVSGYLFTGNPGQSITAKYLACSPASACPPNGYRDDNTGGSSFGSRDATQIGYYEIPVTPGTYTVQVESIYSAFEAGSSVGPLDPPIPMAGPAEFWHQNESATDDTTKKDPITVNAGQTVTATIIVNNTPPRYDQFEDGISLNVFGHDPSAIVPRRNSSLRKEPGL